MQNSYRKPWTEGGFVSLLTSTLKGISQVMLIENAISGLIMLLAISFFSYQLGIIALLSAFIGTIIGRIGGAEEQAINQGLFGYNSVLAGMALTLFLTGPYNWIIALVGAAMTAILTAAMIHMMKNTGIPILTFPYIILTWCTLLASYHLENFHLSSDLAPQNLSLQHMDITKMIYWPRVPLNEIGQIFFIHSALPGILLFIAVFWAGWKLGLYAVLGSACALFASFLLGGDHNLINLGLYGYNAILTILAVAVVFKTGQNRLAPISGIIGACLTVPIIAGVTAWLLPYGLPALTMPFVLCTWLFLGARKVLLNL